MANMPAPTQGPSKTPTVPPLPPPTQTVPPKPTGIPPEVEFRPGNWPITVRWKIPTGDLVPLIGLWASLLVTAWGIGELLVSHRKKREAQKALQLILDRGAEKIGARDETGKFILQLPSAESSELDEFFKQGRRLASELCGWLKVYGAELDKDVESAAKDLLEFLSQDKGPLNPILLQTKITVLEIRIKRSTDSPKLLASLSKEFGKLRSLL